MGTTTRKKLVAIAQDHTACHVHDHYEALRDVKRQEKKLSPDDLAHILFDEFTRAEERALLYNEPTLAYYHEMLSKCTAKEVDTIVILPGDRSQNYTTDDMNRRKDRFEGTSRAVSQFYALQWQRDWFQRHKPAHVKTVKLDTFLLADACANKDAGTEFNNAVSTLKGFPAEHLEVPKADIFATKFPIVYAQVHRLAHDYPNHDIEYWVPDDHWYTLTRLAKFLRDNPDLLPKKVTVKFKLNGVTNTDESMWYGMQPRPNEPLYYFYHKASGYTRVSVDSDMPCTQKAVPYTDSLRGEDRVFFVRPKPIEPIIGTGPTNANYAPCVRDMLINFKRLGINSDRSVAINPQTLKAFLKPYTLPRTRSSVDFDAKIDPAFQRLLREAALESQSGFNKMPDNNSTQGTQVEARYPSFVETILSSFWGLVNPTSPTSPTIEPRPSVKHPANSGNFDSDRSSPPPRVVVN